MRVIERIFGVPTGKRAIGVTSENLATLLIIDVSAVLADHPDAWFTILARRPDGITYPAAPDLRADADGCIRFTLTAQEMAMPGDLALEIQARDGEALIKSDTYTFEIARGIGEPGDPPGPPDPDWVDELATSAHETNLNADRAEQAELAAAGHAASADDSRLAAQESEDLARGYAEDAERYKEDAAGSAEAAHASETAARASEERAGQFAELSEAKFQFFAVTPESNGHLTLHALTDLGDVDARFDGSGRLLIDMTI